MSQSAVWKERCNLCGVEYPVEEMVSEGGGYEGWPPVWLDYGWLCKKCDAQSGDVQPEPDSDIPLELEDIPF